MAALSNHFSSRCSIFENTATGTDAAGQVNETWTLKAGHQHIPCVRGSLPGQANQSEIRRFGYIASLEEQAVLLQGWWPEITDGMHADIDGLRYRVTGVDEESRRVLTRIRVERVA
jgi:hypothetical protein